MTLGLTSASAAFLLWVMASFIGAWLYDVTKKPLAEYLKARRDGK